MYIDLGVILGLYWDNGKENGNFCLGFRVYGIYGLYWGYIGIMEKNMEAIGSG